MNKHVKYYSFLDIETQQNQWQLNTNQYSKESSRLSQRLLKLMSNEVILFILKQSVTLILWKTADEKNIICVFWKQSNSFVFLSFCDTNFVCTFCLWCFHRKQTYLMSKLLKMHQDMFITFNFATSCYKITHLKLQILNWICCSMNEQFILVNI